MFSVVPSLLHISKTAGRHVYLVPDNWDDWFSFRTMFTVYVVDTNGVRHDPGSVKIGETSLKPRGGGEAVEAGFRAPTLPATFGALGEAYFRSARPTTTTRP